MGGRMGLGGWSLSEHAMKTRFECLVRTHWPPTKPPPHLPPPKRGWRKVHLFRFLYPPNLCDLWTPLGKNHNQNIMTGQLITIDCEYTGVAFFHAARCGHGVMCWFLSILFQLPCRYFTYFFFIYSDNRQEVLFLKKKVTIFFPFVWNLERPIVFARLSYCYSTIDRAERRQAHALLQSVRARCLFPPFCTQLSCTLIVLVELAEADSWL